MNLVERKQEVNIIGRAGSRQSLELLLLLPNILPLLLSELTLFGTTFLDSWGCRPIAKIVVPLHVPFRNLF